MNATISLEDLRRYWPTKYLQVIAGQSTFDRVVDEIQPRLHARTTARHAPSPPEAPAGAPEFPDVDPRFAPAIIALWIRAWRDVASADLVNHWPGRVKIVRAFLERLSAAPDTSADDVRMWIEEALAPKEPQVRVRTDDEYRQEIANLERTVRMGRSNPRLLGRLERFKFELAAREKGAEP